MGVLIVLGFLLLSFINVESRRIDHYFENDGLASAQDKIELVSPYKPIPYKLVPLHQELHVSDSQDAYNLPSSYVPQMDKEPSPKATYIILQQPTYSKPSVQKVLSFDVDGMFGMHNNKDEFEGILETMQHPNWQLSKDTFDDDKEIFSDKEKVDGIRTSPSYHVTSIKQGDTEDLHEEPSFETSETHSANEDSEKNGEVHYHQHQHMHKHDHKQNHLHKHKQQHKHQHGHKHAASHNHNHKHGHKHEHKHKQNHQHKHQHEHLNKHKHNHQHGHHHGHKHDHKHAHLQRHTHQHKHGHQHKNEHKHSHKHGHKHQHESQHKHQHNHKQDHKHDHKHDHKQDHDHQHGHKKY